MHGIYLFVYLFIYLVASAFVPLAVAAKLAAPSFFFFSKFPHCGTKGPLKAHCQLKVRNVDVRAVKFEVLALGPCSKVSVVKSTPWKTNALGKLQVRIGSRFHEGLRERSSPMME